MRVITDHMRGVTFMVFDGILPGNEGRGYVLRRLLRRSVRHAKLLGIEGSFLPGVVDRVIDLMREGYPELEGEREFIRRVVAQEEARFHETLDQGMEILDRMAAEVERAGGSVLPGEDAFRLYDTYGFPLELTQEILEARGPAPWITPDLSKRWKLNGRARAAGARWATSGSAQRVAYHEMDFDVDRDAFLGLREPFGRVSGDRIDRPRREGRACRSG